MVGDKEEERRILVDALDELGHTVSEADDGITGWLAFKKGSFDLILSDFIMTKMNGLDLCRKVRAEARNHYTYIIICSTLSGKQHVLEGFKSGVDDYLAKPVDLGELKGRLLSAERVTEVHRALAESNRQLQDLSDQLREESRKDPLTGVGNRLRFADDIPGRLDEFKRYGHQFFLALCDIDNFKKYNDTYGHLEGDNALRGVAQALESHIRSSDRVYRMGGEEFLVILTAQTLEGATIAAERLRGEVEKLHLEHSQNPPHNLVTLSIGLAPLTATHQSQLDLDLRKADEMLYRAKDTGRNKVVHQHSVQEVASS